MFMCGACGHPGVHAQTLAPGASFAPKCPDCPRCQSGEEPGRDGTEE